MLSIRNRKKIVLRCFIIKLYKVSDRKNVRKICDIYRNKDKDGSFLSDVNYEFK